MVKTEDLSSSAGGWSEVFGSSRLLPPPIQTVRRAVESLFAGSLGFQLGLSAAHLPQSQETSEGEQDVAYQLRVTLFDRNHQQFFGKTWKSPPQRMKNNKISFNETDNELMMKLDCVVMVKFVVIQNEHFDNVFLPSMCYMVLQVLYFHTSLRLPSTVMVLELVSLSPRPDGSQQALGRGFAVLELFTNRPEAQAADGDRRLNLHHGSPRGLLHPLLKDDVDYSSFLKTIDGAHLDCVLKNHPALVSITHLLPENVLGSGGETIPGLAASPTGDALLRPQLLKMLPFTLNRLTISLQPSLEKFESQLLQLINADCHNTKQPGPEGALRTVVIQERRLHVGVHNGWCFLEKPQVVVLEPLASGARDRADSTSKQSTLVKDSSATSSLPQTLGLRSSLELRLTNHRALAIIFQLEYVFSAPIGRETMHVEKSKALQACHQICRCHCQGMEDKQYVEQKAVTWLAAVFIKGVGVCQAQSKSYPVSACQQCYPSPDGCIALAAREAVAMVFAHLMVAMWMATSDRGSSLKYLSATSTSRAAFLQCLRWGIWCPFQEPAHWKQEEIQLVLQGGAKPNPHGVMVYSPEMPAKSQSPAPPSAPGTAQVSEAKDMITFRLSSSLERKASSPKASLRTKQEEGSRQRRSPSSPSHDLIIGPESQKFIPPASPPESPPGPGRDTVTFLTHRLIRGIICRSDLYNWVWQIICVVSSQLSLSQLAATSRYPTISHSSSALHGMATVVSFSAPSFPVGIGPPAVTCRKISTPLLGDHFLYLYQPTFFQACSGVSNIAHLEVDLHREGNVSPSAQDEGDPLQELPFTPVHAPVITLGMNVPSSCSVSSRSSLAHLYSAGFPNIVDCGGQVAEVLDPTEPVPFDPQREETDPLQSNLLVFQFLGFTRVPMAGVGPDWPDNIYFTFQFYRFPPVTSQQLKLLTSDKVQQRAGDPLPCVLASINKDGTVSSGSPGLQVQFRVDKAFLKPGEKRWFLRYLALHTMHIDVWDSDSLLLIGSTAIELKYMLRQGKPAVQALHEVEVLTTDYTLDFINLAFSPEVRGNLLILKGTDMKTNNVKSWRYSGCQEAGCPVDPSRRRAADMMPSQSHIITPLEVTSGFRGGSLSSRNILRLNGKPTQSSRNVAQAHRLEIDGDRVPLLRRDIGADTVMSREHNLNEPDGGRRKLSCMAAVHQREGKKDVKAAKITDRTKEAQLARELNDIHPSEERSKAEGIATMLSQAITTQHLLYTSLGSAEYMEFVLKNPFNVPQTVTIHSDDLELSVITDIEEWRYFKVLTKTTTPLEENMFHLEEGAPGPRVYLRPKESIHIPLKYQSFLCDHSLALQGPSFLPTGKGSQVAKKNLSNIVVAKTIKVTFKAEDGKPMAICQVNVEPTPHVVDQTFRLYHPELCFLKKAIRLPPWHNPIGTSGYSSYPLFFLFLVLGDPNARTHISVRCSDPNIICQTRMLVPGEPQDVYLKVPGSPSPHIKMFFVMVFTSALLISNLMLLPSASPGALILIVPDDVFLHSDKWMAAPSQIWQIYVHFLERVDVSCVSGQRSCQSLVLRGKQAVRKVKCFSSHPQETEVDPEGVFVLPPTAVQELQLKVQPWRAGSRFLYVNAVDVDHRRLVTAWLLCLNVHRPVLSKAFEVCVPVGGGRGSSRKITYTNPYTSNRTFLLRSDHPDLLQFKEDKFQIGGGESYTIGLRFAPSQRPGSVEILVYMNNLEEKTEETFCVKVSYS
ncbi:hypothetical protein L3Q82_015577 [Scortum barcoo]|uniref:Uncharacterized protein n=1 Tax=Scortum barcoo TaxID=214431 RepID=A0ACB8VNK3_9TELE|nr:hypothetical protein L3Q82_015577 [Scortum barcoo]